MCNLHTFVAIEDFFLNFVITLNLIHLFHKDEFISKFSHYQSNLFSPTPSFYLCFSSFKSPPLPLVDPFYLFSSYSLFFSHTYYGFLSSIFFILFSTYNFFKTLKLSICLYFLFLSLFYLYLIFYYLSPIALSLVSVQFY